MTMLRILIALPLVLAVGGCAAPGLGTKRPPDVSVAKWRGDLREPAKFSNSPASASRPEPPRTVAKAGTAPTAKPAQPVAEKTCRLRNRVWQGWRWVCP